MYATALSLAGLAALAAPASAQFTDWANNQINTSICIWEQPRAAVIRDTVYLDGGNIWWSPGLDSGIIGGAESEGNNQGLILTYNFSQPFTPDTNQTGLLLKDDLSKARGGSGNANSAAPNYYDGGLLGNYDEFFLYAGVIINVEGSVAEPDADDVLSYQEFAYGPDKPLWEPGFDDETSGDHVNRYIAYGAAVSAPSENLAWYFSGLTSPTRGPIYFNPLNSSTEAANISDTFIGLNMTFQGSETWTNGTLPPSVKGRSNAEIVWVPVGEQGILVVLGGVVFPEWANVNHISTDPDASEDESPDFMSTLDIYDVAGDNWYKQDTKDGPGALARGCAVMAPASDSSSFNIYYYGGYDGVHIKDDFSDAVWVLSVPSFTWTKISNGTSLHARAGHKCFMPYPDQMMVFGGYTPQPGATISCLDNPIVLFNLSSGEWMDSYDPAKHDDYAVPAKVQDAIGGNGAGGATATEPSGGWATSATPLADVFAKAYDTDKIQTFYPYAVASSTSRPDLPGNDDDHHGSSGLPSWVAPVLGVVLGLIVLTSATVLFCLWRRRKILRQRRNSEPSTVDAGGRILSWIKGQGAPNEKAVTVASSDEGLTSPSLIDARLAGSTAPSVPTPLHHETHHEVADSQVPVEMADTSPLNELPDAPLSHYEVLTKHTRVGKNINQSMTSPSYSYSSFSISGPEEYSSISHSSAANNSTTALNAAQGDNHSPEPSVADSRVTSGVSALTEQQRSHLRNISEVTDADAAPGAANADEPQRPASSRRASESGQSPISPPTAGEAPTEDYLGARNLASPLRRSVFREEDETDKDKE